MNINNHKIIFIYLFLILISLPFITGCKEDIEKEQIRVISTSTLNPTPAPVEPYIFVTKWGYKGINTETQLTSTRYFKVTNKTIQNLQNVFNSNQLESLECIKNQEFIEDGFQSMLKYLDFNDNEIELIIENSVIGNTGKTDDFHPSRIQISKTKYIYVLYPGDAYIFKYDSNGNFITKFGGYWLSDNKKVPPGKFNDPKGIAIDANENIFVSDMSSNRIQKFNSDGDLITKWDTDTNENEKLDLPFGLAIDLANNIYVISYYGHSIQKYNSDNNLLMKWNPIDNFGPNSEIRDIAIDPSGNIFIAYNTSSPVSKAEDSENSKEYTFTSHIQIYDSSGKLITQWDGYKNEKEKFNNIGGIAIDTKSNVFITEYRKNHVAKMDINGNFICKWGNKGSGDGEFQWPEGIAIDPEGNIYVADNGNNRIQKFSQNKNYKPE